LIRHSEIKTKGKKMETDNPVATVRKYLDAFNRGLI
jgi:hypothetical protein